MKLTLGGWCLLSGALALFTHLSGVGRHQDDYRHNGRHGKHDKHARADDDDDDDRHGKKHDSKKCDDDDDDRHCRGKKKGHCKHKHKGKGKGHCPDPDDDDDPPPPPPDDDDDPPPPPTGPFINADGSGSAFAGTVSVSADSIHLIARGAQPTGVSEFDGTVTVGGDPNHLVVPSGVTTSATKALLEAGTWASISIEGTLIVTGGGAIAIECSGDVLVAGAILVDSNATRLSFEPALNNGSNVFVSGEIDVSAQTAGGQAGSIAFRPLSTNAENKWGNIRVDGTLTAASEEPTLLGGTVEPVALDQAVLNGNVNVGGRAGGRGGALSVSAGTAVIHASNVSTLGGSGVAPTSGGTIALASGGIVELGSVELRADGGAPPNGPGAAGGAIQIEGTVAGDLASANVAGTLSASGGFGSSRGSGGVVYIGEDPTSQILSLDTASAIKVLGIIEVLGPGGDVDFHAASVLISSGARVEVPEGTIRTRANTTVTVESQSIVSDGDGDADLDGTDIDATGP